MFNSILSSQLREKAGSDSYNRYEYQVHYIVYHVIESYKQQKDLLIFCEFHDDMADCNNHNNPDFMDFYQIKTSDSNKTWSLKSLFYRDKRPNGTYKNSFLGFIFYNFTKFSTECSRCHFISNAGFSEDILKWQSIIQDNKPLLHEDRHLYNAIKELMRKEYCDIDVKEFNSYFETFIQNTFITKTHITLEAYEEQIKGIFFEFISKFNVDTSFSYRLLQDIIDTIRKKSKTIVKIPISYSELKNKKSISTKVLKELENNFREIPKQEKLYKDIEEYLQKNKLDIATIRQLVRKLKSHHRKMLDINDTLYQDLTRKFILSCQKIINEPHDSFQQIKTKSQVIIDIFLSTHHHIKIDSILLKGVFYEALLSDSSDDL